MKITKKHNNGLTTFNTLEPGDVFLHCNNWYVKTEYNVLKTGGSVNAVDIQRGVLSLFSAQAEIKKVEAEMIVEV